MRFGNRVLLAFGLILSGCATSSSDLKLSEVPKDHGVIAGHIDVYNGEEKLDLSATFKKCFATFSDSKGDRQAYVKLDETGWVFAEVPQGSIYLSGILCLPGYMKSHLELETRQLEFAVAPDREMTYFGDVVFHFNYHGVSVLGMFGLVGAATQVATESGSPDAVQIKIEDKFDAASREYGQRFPSDSNSPRLFDATVQMNAPRPSPASAD